MIQTERIGFKDSFSNEEDFIRGNGHIKEPAVAKAAIREAYIRAYQRGWRPGDLESAQKADLSATLSEIYQKINGRLLDELADGSDLVKVREGVIQEIRSGTLSRN